MRRTCFTILLPVSLLVTAALPAAAQWLPGGVRLCQSGCTGDAPQVIPDGAGGAFVAWRETSPINSSDIYLQRVTASGLIAPGWPPGGLPVAVLPRTQEATDMAPDGQGGALVVWYDHRNVELGTSQDVYAQRLLADGSIAAGWPVNGTPVTRAPDYQFRPFIAPDGAGGAYVAWSDQRDYPNTDVYAQHLTADGVVAAGWPSDGLPVCTVGGDQDPWAVVPDVSGGVVVVWADARDGAGATYAQRLRPDGSIAPGWMENGLLIVGQYTRGGAVADNAGGFYAAAATLHPVYFDEVEYFVQRFTFDGVRAAGWPEGGLRVCGAPGVRVGLRLAEDGRGGVLLAWQDERDLFGGGGIYAARVLPAGVLASGWSIDGTLVSDPVGPGFEFDPDIAGDGAGGCYLAWQREGGGERPSLVQHLTASGAVAPGWPAAGVRLAPSNSQYDTQIASDARGGAIAVWMEQQSRRGIWAQRFVLDGPVAAQVSLVRAAAEPDRVVLVWHVADASSFSAAVERRAVHADWERLAAAHADGTGRIEYVDRAVAPGDKYAYRLTFRDDGVERHTIETWVDVPAALVLTLEGLRPNPAVGAVVAAFALPHDTPATLELLDVAGRQVSARPVGSLGPGRHTVRLDDDGRLAPGVYWLRLTQGGQVLMARGAVVR